MEETTIQSEIPENRVFILGAGFTKAITGKSLLTNELMDKICDLIIPELVCDYKDIYPDIELFITLLDIRILQAKKPELRQKLENGRKEIIKKIENIFKIDNFNEEYPNCEKFIEKISRNDTIITLNYDCVLDRYLCLSKRWDPNNGYGFPANSSSKDKENPENILLLKIHGSLNFRERKNYGNDSKLKKEKCDYPFIEINKKIFPILNSNLNNRNSKLDSGAHILYMSYIKQPSNQLMRIWKTALERIEESKKLTIIGCSIRDEDEFLKFLLYNFSLKTGASDKIEIEIVDKDEESGAIIKKKIKNLIVHPDNDEKFKIYKNFEEYLKGSKN